MSRWRLALFLREVPGGLIRAGLAVPVWGGTPDPEALRSNATERDTPRAYRRASYSVYKPLLNHLRDKHAGESLQDGKDTTWPAASQKSAGEAKEDGSGEKSFVENVPNFLSMDLPSSYTELSSAEKPET